MTTIVNRNASANVAAADVSGGVLNNSIPSVFGHGYNASVGSYELCAVPQAAGTSAIAAYGITT